MAAAKVWGRAAIVDLLLPDGNGHRGLPVAARVERHADLMLSAIGHEDQKVALEADAEDYVVKPFSPRELVVARLRAALRRAEGTRSEPKVSVGALDIDLAAPIVSREGEAAHLTPTGYDLLRVLVSNRGRLLTHRALLVEVWGVAYARDVQTLRTHIANLRAGKVYPPERVAAALNGFFRIENLTALREVALRQVAEEVGAKRVVTETLGTREDPLAIQSPQAVSERLLALVEPYPGSQRLVRRAWRSAQRLGAELDLLWVKPPGRKLTPEQETQVRALRELASVLGAQWYVEESDDIPREVTRFAGGRGTTYILMGAARERRGLARLRTPLPQRLMRAMPGVDVRIVADRSRRLGGES